MKKVIACFLSLMLVFSVAVCFAEETEPFFAQFDGFVWSFCSGAGAWSTDMQIAPDGSFMGYFHDSDMGDAEDTYPNGTIYYCSFSGTLSLVEQIDEYSWKIRVDALNYVEKPAETIEDGVRYIYSPSCGLSEGDEMVLYRPGAPVANFSEDVAFWAHLYDYPEMPSELANWFLSSEANNSGFEGTLIEQ